MIRMFLLVLSMLALAGCGVRMGVPHTPGAFIQAAQGKTFKPMDTLDPRNAMIYIYRPPTEWGYEEVQAPTIFIDGTQLFGLKSGAYEWLEVPGGHYELTARRPMSVLFIKTVFDLHMNIEGGKTYFLRYSEKHPVRLEEIADHPDKMMQDGPVQQVPKGYAMQQIQHLRLDEPGVYYGGGDQNQPRWAPFYTMPLPPQPEVASNGDQGNPNASPAPQSMESRGWWSRTRSWFANLF